MREIPLTPTSTLMDAVRAIEISPRRMTVIVDLDEQLLGTLTDGDIRRHLLAGGSLDDLASKAMNKDPVTAVVGSSVTTIQDLLRVNNVIALPIVDSRNSYIELIHLIDLMENYQVEKRVGETFSFAVVMAGGEGSRLRPLTLDTPKPMVKVGDLPLLEHQIRNLSSWGINKIFISINYLGSVIEDYFEDGKKFGVAISYLKEDSKRGTAGSLSLLPVIPTQPFLVVNGDILTTSDFSALFSYHKLTSSMITIGAVEYRIEIPYGVIKMNGESIGEILEKPSEKHLCSAGIYAISPEVLQLIPSVDQFNMTDFVGDCLNRGLKISAFPIHEYWADIGTVEDLEKARARFIKTEITSENN